MFTIADWTVLALTIVLVESNFSKCNLINGDLAEYCDCTPNTIAQCAFILYDNSSKTCSLNISSIVANDISSKYEMKNHPIGGLEMSVFLDKLTVPGMSDKFSHSLGGYLQHNGATIKTLHLFFSSLPKFNATNLVIDVTTVCGYRQPTQVFKITIDNIFDTSQSFFELTGIINCTTNIEIVNIPVPLRVENFLNLSEVENLTFRNTSTYYDITPIFLSSNLNSIIWEADKFFPQFYQTSNEPQFYTNVSLMGSDKSTYLHKEVFFYTGSINLIQLTEYIDRIEYGTFALPGKFKQFVCNNAADNPNCTEIESLFLDGECLSLDQNLCEICFMHQYGFHRTMDNVREKCSNKEPVQYSMLNCFWREIQPIPQSMKNLSIDTSWLNTDVKPCRSFPFDIAMLIRALRSASHSPDMIPEESTVTTPQ